MKKKALSSVILVISVLTCIILEEKNINDELLNYFLKDHITDYTKFCQGILNLTSKNFIRNHQSIEEQKCFEFENTLQNTPHVLCTVSEVGGNYYSTENKGREKKKVARSIKSCIQIPRKSENRNAHKPMSFVFRAIVILSSVNFISFTIIIVLKFSMNEQI